MANTVDKIVKWALEQVGYKANKDKTNKYAEYIDNNYADFYNGKKDGFDWCDVCVDCGFIQTYGYEEALRLLCQPKKSLGAGVKYSAQYYKNKKQYYTSNPMVGDQIFFKNSKGICHTGIVVEVRKTELDTVEGNASNTVKRKTYKLTDKTIDGFGRPKYDLAGVPVVAPTTSNELKKGSKGEAVKTLQKNLNTTIKANLLVDGEFLEKTEKAVKDFQKKYGLYVDGIYGAKTDAKMQEVLKSATATPSFKPYAVVVIAKSGLNLRSGAGTNYGILTALPCNTQVTVTEVRNGWGKVVYLGKIGWINLQYTKKN